MKLIIHVSSAEFGSDSEEMSTTEAVNRLLIEHVFPLSEKRAGDVEGEELLSKDVFELWREHEPQILKVFESLICVVMLITSKCRYFFTTLVMDEMFHLLLE